VTSAELKARIYANDPSHTIVVDMRSVTFCDSSGLAALLAGLEYTATARGALVLRQPSPPVMRLLRLTGTTNAFTIEPAPGPAPPELPAERDPPR